MKCWIPDRDIEVVIFMAAVPLGLLIGVLGQFNLGVGIIIGVAGMSLIIGTLCV